VKKYTVIAYADEDGYPRQSTTIEAANQEDAQSRAWKLFPEYHEVGVFEEAVPQPTPVGMKILVACEESQAVTKELRRLGHEAYSCDIVEQSGGHPEWHIMQDVLPLLNGNCTFKTTDGTSHSVVGKWDMLIAFPPCTHLAVSGARHFEAKRADGRQREGIEFFCQFLNADCDHVAIENPVGIISGDYIPQWFPDLAERYGLPRRHSQIIQPYEFGDPHKKTTCLWLKGLPLLTPTNVVEPDLISYECKSGKKVTFSKYMVHGFSNEDRAKHRSKTFPGIAKAMAEQWAGPCEPMSTEGEPEEWML
jgi:hypothetical protein